MSEKETTSTPAPQQPTQQPHHGADATNKGDAGHKGAQGDKGAQGPKGDKG